MFKHLRIKMVANILISNYSIVLMKTKKNDNQNCNQNQKFNLSKSWFLIRIRYKVKG